nr:hypothetical protein CFP56_25877 [Quercus suber]
MDADLFWIHKSADSNALSHSAKSEASGIRRHVQTTRRAKTITSSGHAKAKTVLQDGGSNDRSKPIRSYKTALSLSLRPNTGFGRISRTGVLASALAADGRSASGTDYSPSETDIRQRCRFNTLPSGVPWMWQGFRPEERSSLAFFQLRTSRDWAGWQDAPFWSALVLPLSHQSRAVANSLIALSALHESKEVNDECYRTRLRCMSISHSGKMVQELAGSNLTYFEAIVSCVIVLCFQNIHGHRKSFRLLRSGLQLLEQRKNHVSKDEEDSIQRHIKPVFDLLHCRICRMGDLASSIVISVRNQQGQTVDHHRTSIPTIPATFKTMLEARDCLQSILDWGHDAAGSYYLHKSSNADFAQSLQHLRKKWETALRLYSEDKAGTEMMTVDRSTGLLRAACIVGTILLQTFNTQREEIYDDYISDFRSIVELVEQANSSVDSHRRQISFGIDGGLVDIIKFVGIKCRDPNLRRRALQMLCSGGRIEGDRTASIPGEILRTQIELEERGLDVSLCEDVPETNRWRLLVGHQLFQERKIELFYIASPYELGANAVIETRRISLLGPCEEAAGGTCHSSIPDAIFGSGYAEFLDDRASGQYFRLDLERFHFPIPRE